MSTNIVDLKTIGMTLIHTAERHIDVEPIQNEIAAIGSFLILVEFSSRFNVHLFRSILV